MRMAGLLFTGFCPLNTAAVQDSEGLPGRLFFMVHAAAGMLRRRAAESEKTAGLLPFHGGVLLHKFGSADN